MDSSIFRGRMPALMTPCDAERRPDNDVLVRTGEAQLRRFQTRWRAWPGSDRAVVGKGRA